MSLRVDFFDYGNLVAVSRRVVGQRGAVRMDNFSTITGRWGNTGRRRAERAGVKATPLMTTPAERRR